MQKIDVIPIVYATDDNYVMPTAVAIKSLVANYTGEYLFFVILVQGRLSDKSIKLLNNAIKSKCVNTEIKLVSVDETLFGNLKSHISHITMATYFRLLLPDLLSGYKKCLYLDGDICVSGDISDVLNIKMGMFDYIAGVKAFSIITSKLVGEKRLKILNIGSLEHYVNAGVLLMNLEALRSSGVSSMWLDLAQNDYPVQDQDVINVACYNHILNISPRYNSMPAIYRYSLGRLQHVYTREEIEEARKNPCIIHYAEKYKPWKYSDVEMAKVWRKYYRMLFQEEISSLKKIGFTRFIDTQKGRLSYIINKVKRK